MLRRLKQWWRPKQVEIIRRDPLRLTVEEFRSDKSLTNAALRMLHDPAVRQMLDTLHASHVRRYAATGTAEERAFHLSRCEGYQAALNDFESLGRFEEPRKPLEADFASSAIETEP